MRGTIVCSESILSRSRFFRNGDCNREGNTNEIGGRLPKKRSVRPLQGAAASLAQQLGGVDIERVGDTEQGVQIGPAHFALDVTDNLIGQPGTFGNSRKRKLSFEPLLLEDG